MQLDDGFQFGIGAFETIAVYKNKPIFINEHLQRLNKTLSFLEINRTITEKDISTYIDNKKEDYYALKIMVSEKNLIVTTRPITYTKDKYLIGFETNFSTIKRNNTSPFVYHKTLNYGECITQKRFALKNNLDELIFLNFEDEICEGTTSNIFFVKNNQLFTPKLSSGLLSGIMRDYVCKNYDVIETSIKALDINDFDECFVTNSLMAIMPVNRLFNKRFEKREVTNKIKNNYFDKFLNGYEPIN